MASDSCPRRGPILQGCIPMAPGRVSLLPLLAVPLGVIAPRPSGPCSEWFDNAWLKSRGFSADVCCWRNHSACWDDGHDYDSCCGDYDVREYDRLLLSVGKQPNYATLRAAALPLQSEETIGTMLDGLLDVGVPIQAPAYVSPRSFFRSAAPSAALAGKIAGEEDAVRRGVGSTTGGSKLVLFVMTGPGNFARRQAMRRTWLQMLAWPGSEGVKYAFVAGAPDETTIERIPTIAQELVDEQREFSDLLVLPSLRDVYWGWEHTVKTFLALLAVLAREPRSPHFACLHDDVYVHVPRLVDLLANRSSMTREGEEEEGSAFQGYGLYLGNAYRGHEFVGHAATDGPEYEAMHGHRKMPPIMKGGLWVVDITVARWVAAMLASPVAILPWRLWPSDDDSVGLVFGELHLQRDHALRHGVEWFDWRLGDRCDGQQLVVAHDLKTPRELLHMWSSHLALQDPCAGFVGGTVRLSSRPEDFGQSA